MRGPLGHIRRKLRRFRRREDGNSTIDTVIMLPVFLLVFLSSYELAMISLRQTVLERSLDLVVRDLRISGGGGAAIEHEDLREALCAQTWRLIPDCEKNLLIDLQPIDKVTWAVFDTEATCVDRREIVNPPLIYDPGSPNEPMLIRACAIVDPFFPTMGLGLALEKDPTGGFRLISTSAFVNEP